MVLHGVAVDAAARATFECRGCTQPSTPHTLTFVFSFDGRQRGQSITAVVETAAGYGSMCHNPRECPA
jgi:hypothetical protein